ncbi:MAG: hypothetical protein PVJ49_12100 [Acidobacteriota bacterium]|jgi:hypothetical protein
MRRTRFLPGSIVILVALCCAALPTIAAGAPQDKETFRATAQAIGTGLNGQTTVIISISRWSTDAERNELATVLADQGSNALADALAEQEETGFIRFPQAASRQPSVRLRYAREFPHATGRTIILATDRPIGWAEAVARPQRTINSQITLIQLDVDADGRGEGVMAVGAELLIDADSNTLKVKNISSQPVRLVNVRH